MMIDSIISKVQQISSIYSKTIIDKNPSSKEFFSQKVTNKTFELEKTNIDFINKSLDFFESIDAEKIILYNSHSDAILSSNNRNYTKENEELSFYSLFHFLDQYFYNILNSNNKLDDVILKAQSIFKVTYNTRFQDNYELVSNQSILTTYVPIYNYQTFKVDGILEVIIDVTNQLDQIDFITFRSLIICLSLFFGFLILVIFLTRNVQKIINKQIKTNRELEDAKILAEAESSAKTEFLANVSHELRTPLNSIIGFSEIIINDKNKINHSDDKYIDYINDINNSGKHLLEIINDILDFSKASSDKLQVENIEIDLNKICQSSMRFVKPRADQAKIKLIEIMPEKHVVIKADPKRLKQALLNLLSNSVKFTPENGSVTIEIKIDHLQEKVAIIVQDTGIGIAQKDIPKAMSVFYQIDNKLSRKYEGTGLGLPLTKKLVELMGGEFEITSQENIGTIVTLKFKADQTLQEI